MAVSTVSPWLRRIGLGNARGPRPSGGYSGWASACMPGYPGLPGLPGCARLRSRPAESGVIVGDWREVARLVSDKVGGRYSARSGEMPLRQIMVAARAGKPGGSAMMCRCTAYLRRAYPIRMAVVPRSWQAIKGLGPDGATHRKGYQS
jgi:hypothetical protein